MSMSFICITAKGLNAFQSSQQRCFRSTHTLENKSLSHLLEVVRNRSLHDEFIETREYTPETIYEKVRSIFHICHKTSSE